MPDEHDCNAYCSGGDHCDLVYYGGSSGAALARRYAGIKRVDIVRVKVAREAAPVDIALDAGYVLLAGQEPSDNTRWLIWWRQPHGRWTPPTQGEMRALTGE